MSTCARSRTPATARSPGVRNTITMTARLSPRNSEVLAPLYGSAPLDLSSIRLRSVHLDWHGPTVTLRLDLPDPPLPLPEDWAAEGVDTVQGQLQFLAVEDLELDAWEPGMLVSFELELSESWHRIRVAVSQGEKSGFLSFGASADVLVGHVSGFQAGPEGSDSGPHRFRSRLDARLHTTVPDPSEKTFYENL
ncbi:Imm50 family immunity protein [Streptomyces californicus]|uniref:Imm50 family immunity protein n=1 Tax=Streptomyces californicus TaxID=67351 RepID=UPI00296EDDDF|nr:Imm50 family immunity protein [Streptomyces californicus]MDW4913275.1 Imm50 family immunity protein [Streptomyces californicus]